VPDYRHLAYRLGSDPVRLVIANGHVVEDRLDPAGPLAPSR
jgi:hypothetical protein